MAAADTTPDGVHPLRPRPTAVSVDSVDLVVPVTAPALAGSVVTAPDPEVLAVPTDGR